MKHVLLLILGLTLMMGVPAIALAPAMPDDSFSMPEPDQFTVASGGPYVVATHANQRFIKPVNAKPEQARGTVSLKIQNNYWDWFRILVAGKVVASQKDLLHETKDGGWEGTVNLSGTLKPGANQLLVEGAGRPGTSLCWELTTFVRAVLNGVVPGEASPGDTVTLKGKNFSTATANNRVYFNDIPGNVVSATAEELKVQLPEQAQAGEQVVQARVRNEYTNRLSITIRGPR